MTSANPKLSLIDKDCDSFGEDEISSEDTALLSQRDSVIQSMDAATHVVLNDTRKLSHWNYLMMKPDLASPFT